MGKITVDLGSIFGLWGDKTPQANPVYGATYDEESPSGWSYADGTNVTDPDHIKKLTDSSFKNDSTDFGGSSTPEVTKQKFTMPSDWTQTFHPDVANYETKSNIAGTQALTDATNAQDVDTAMKARVAKKIRPAIGQPVNSVSDENLGLLTNGNVTSQNLDSVIGTQANTAAGNPQLEALARSAELEKSQRQTYAGNLLGTPEWNAQNERYGAEMGATANKSRIPLVPLQTNLDNATLNYDINEANRRLRIQPTTSDTLDTQTDTQNIMAHGINAAAPTAAATEPIESIIKKAIAANSLEHLGTTLNTMDANRLTAARDATHPSTMANPMYLTPEGGKARNPFFSSTLESMPAKIGTAGGSTGTPLISTGVGTHIGPPVGGTNGVTISKGLAPRNTNGIPAVPLQDNTPASPKEKGEATINKENPEVDKLYKKMMALSDREKLNRYGTTDPVIIRSMAEKINEPSPFRKALNYLTNPNSVQGN